MSEINPWTSSNTSEGCTTDTSNPDKIMISHTEWAMICKKVDSINLTKEYDLENILLGALISVLLTLAPRVFNSPQPKDFIPLAISLTACMLYSLIKNKFSGKFFQNSTPENIVHLKELKDTISDISNRYSTKKKKDIRAK